MLNLDNNEPTIILELLKPCVELNIGAWNQAGHSDYHWTNSQGKWVEVERKTWGEIFADVHAVEEQMYRHLRRWPEAYHVFLLEGLAVPTVRGMSNLRSTKNNTIWVKGYDTPRNSKSIKAWLYEIGKAVDIMPSSSMEDSATTLLAMYENDQKSEHRTFSRNYTRPTYTPNYVVSQIMGMYPGIGETRATALWAKFTTLWNLVNASVKEIQEVHGIGPVLARRILREAGRPDIV